MPTYEYTCTECGHEWEQEQRITAKPCTKCPSCGKHGAKRLISSGNFILKGKGWYETDYGKGKRDE
jgi:putative FmdB family regulatory protein